MCGYSRSNALNYEGVEERGGEVSQMCISILSVKITSNFNRDTYKQVTTFLYKYMSS
jgi:hypothetical protein